MVSFIGFFLLISQAYVASSGHVVYESPCIVNGPPGTGLIFDVPFCKYELKEFFYSPEERMEAAQDCLYNAQQYTDTSLDSCGRGGYKRWGLYSYENSEWPRCITSPDNTSNTCEATGQSVYSGRYYVGFCPEDSYVIQGIGCVQKDEPQECEISVGNPINIGTGSKYHNESIDVGNDNFNLILNYSSNYRIDRFGDIDKNNLAPGWSHNYDKSISRIFNTPSGQVVFVYHEKGRHIRFDKTNDEWLPHYPESGMELTQTDNGWLFKLFGANEYYEYQNNQSEIALIKNIKYHNGKSLSFGYSSYVPAFVDEVIDEYGNALTFKHFNSALYGVRIYEVEYSDGRTWQLGFDDTGGTNATGNLESVTYPDGTKNIFHYEDVDSKSVTRHKHALTGITDRRGIRYATYEYDSNRKVIKEWHGDGSKNNTNNINQLSIVYNNDNTRTVTNSRGYVSNYEVQNNNGFWKIKSSIGPGCSSCPSDNLEFVYDTNDNVISEIEDGVITKYFNYDSKGQYGYKIEAFGTPEERRTDYKYDSRFINKPTIVKEESILSGQFKSTQYIYNSNGQVTSVTENGYQPDGSPITRTTTFEYDGPINQLSQIDGPRTDVNDIITYTYYDKTEPNTNNINRLKRVTDPTGIILRDNIAYTNTGKILSEDRPNNLQIINTFEPNTDRLLTVTANSLNDTETITVAFSYIASGELKTVTTNHGTNSSVTLTLNYDDAKRLIRIVDQMGQYIQYSLDSEGNQLFEKIYDPNGNLLKNIEYAFDAYNRLQSETQSGISIQYNHSSDGTVDNEINGNGVVTDYSYDNLKRLTQILNDHNGSTSQTSNTLTTFTYDVYDRIKTITDARGNSTTYQYNDLGDLITLSSPDTGTTNYTYDQAGNRVSKTDANGVTQLMNYDASNRLITTTVDDKTLNIQLSYDQGMNGINKLTGFSDHSGSTSISYNGFGLIYKTSQNHKALNSPLEFIREYDDNNRLYKLIYPSGLEVYYSFNDLGKINRVSIGDEQSTIDLINQVSYLPFGPINSMRFGNGLTYSASYDLGYRLDDYSYGTLIDTSLGYDNNHNVVSITRESSVNNRTYGYDAMDRLKSDSYQFQSFSYDKLGNRIVHQKGFTSVQLMYETNSNRLRKIGSNPDRSYDNNGNTLTNSNQGKQHLRIYNDLGRLSSFYENRVLKAEYRYNAIGQRVMKSRYGSSDDKDSYYIYNQKGQLVYEGQYERKANYNHFKDIETIWLQDIPIAQVHTRYSNNQSEVIIASQDVYFVHVDHLNTPRWITNDLRTIVWSWESDAFGETLPNNDPDNDGQEHLFNLRFPGQYYDSESDTNYNFFRNYDSDLGRYLESDPIGLSGGINTYNYVKSNPLNSYDLLGLFDEDQQFDEEVEFGWPLCNFFGRECRKPLPDIPDEVFLKYCECAINCGIEEIMNIGWDDFVKKSFGAALTMSEQYVCVEKCVKGIDKSSKL